jgi:hypothetical protein
VSTAVVYRVPDLPATALVEMFANLEREGVVPLVTVETRQSLWRNGGAHARLAERLNRVVNTHAAEVVPFV